MKKLINISLAIIVGVGFLLLAFYKVDLGEVLLSFKKFNYIYIAPVIVLYVLYFLIRGYRWGLIFTPHPKPPFRSLFSCVVIGVMVNNLIPAKIGEMSRAVILGKKEKISITLTLGTIIVERIFDLIALFFCLFTIFLFSAKERILLTGAETSPVIKTAFFTTLIGFLVLIIAVVIFKQRTEWFIRVVERIAGIFSSHLSQKIDKWFRSFAEGLKCLDDHKNSLKILVASIVQWLVSGFATWIAFYSFNIPLSFASALFVMIIITLGLVLPPSPGGIGPTQFIAVIVLAYYGVSKADALGFSMFSNFMAFSVGTVLGAIFLFRESLNLSQLLKFSEEKE